MTAHLRPALVSLLLLTLITGVAYPLVVTGVAQVVFPHQANGSLIVRDGRTIGSALIGQPFDDPKYFAIIPAAFATTYPALGALNVTRLATPESAILSAVIFNALIIVALIPLALKGVRYRAIGAAAVLRRHLWIYGAGGILIPFPGIKIVDMILVALDLV